MYMLKICGLKNPEKQIFPTTKTHRIKYTNYWETIQHKQI